MIGKQQSGSQAEIVRGAQQERTCCQKLFISQGMEGTLSKELLSCSTLYISIILGGYNQYVFLRGGCPTTSKGYSLDTQPK